MRTKGFSTMPCSFAITPFSMRSPKKAVRVEEAMDRHCEGMTHARGGADDVRARPQVSDLAQELHRVRLGLDRVCIGIVHPSDHLDARGLHLEGLSLGGRCDDGPGRFDGATCGEALHFGAVVFERRGRYDLYRMEARTVAHMDEGQARLRVPSRAHPALHGDGLVVGGGPPEDFTDG